MDQSELFEENNKFVHASKNDIRRLERLIESNYTATLFLIGIQIIRWMSGTISSNIRT
jgi:hypothetical protein